jgi:hypothetical protein
MKKLIAALATLAMSIIPTFVFAQFNPGNEAAASSGVGGATMLEIQQVAPGKAVLVVTTANAVYKGTVPSDVKAHYSDKSESGDGGTDYVVDVASNPALANQQLCWRGVGGDWNVMTCGALSGGTAKVTVDVGAARNTVFALVPIIASQDGKKQLAWAAHPENSKVVLTCPGRKGGDMASLLRVDKDGSILIDTSDKAVASYNKRYADFCKRR